VISLQPNSVCVSCVLNLKILYVFLVSSIDGELQYHITGTNYDRLCIPTTGKLDKCTRNQKMTITLFPHMVYLMNPVTDVGWESVVGKAICYGLDSPGIESQWGMRFSATVQTDSGDLPSLLCNGWRVSFLGIKRLACNADNNYTATPALGLQGQFYGDLYL
jgi:hypothetical protein